MSEPLSAERLREAVRSLIATVAESTASEASINGEFKATTDATEAEYRRTMDAITEELQSGQQKLEHDATARRKRLSTAFTTEYGKAERTYEVEVATINEKAETSEKATRKAYDEAIWLTDSVYDAGETQPNEQFENTRKQVDGCGADIQEIENAAGALLQRLRQKALRHDLQPVTPAFGGPVPVDDVPSPSNLAVLSDELNQHVLNASASLNSLRKLRTPKLFIGGLPFVLPIVGAGIGGAIAAALNNWVFDQQAMIGAGAGLFVTVAVLIGLYFLARSSVRAGIVPLRESMADSRRTGAQLLRLAALWRDHQKISLVERRDADIAQAKEQYEPILTEIASRREMHMQRIHTKYPALMSEMKAKYEADLAELETAREAKLNQLATAYESAEAAAQKLRDEKERAARLRYEDAWKALVAHWREKTTAAYAVIESSRNASDALFLPFNSPQWSQWQPPTTFAPAIRFGSLEVDLARLPGGLPRDPRLELPGPSRFTVPSLLSFHDRGSLLVETGSDGRAEAVAVLQTVMFRLVSALPPGKVRFTIFDPVGLGQNFAGFMHLADYDGAYVGDKIWTEERHIEQRLLDLTEHMENVIQKYLRNEYQTITDYNEEAGEIAEPLRFLVIANFPVNFSEAAAKRLASIVSTGARCGVYTLITADVRQQLPPGMAYSDIERYAVTLAWDSGALRWKDADYAPLPLALDQPPPEELVTEKLHIIGRKAKETGKVEVPFRVIAPQHSPSAPQQAKLWTESSATDVRVALGRAGATKLQYLSLGHGTSQHALIAGKTGSGKSTLLHALITNLALWYSPHEVEFYLVDFKKGVEFKTYATHHLPHARAVAIESDREFGLSVLQRLDGELRRRGNLYRDLGVQDLAGYRRSGHPEPLPRTLLIIDEFQEMFTEDDKLGQDASLLLDRLVRQGRAFGIHVILGSQTLGGAYSLARSTIGQMGVRIALQCSEADSYLILSDDNAAARLLSRPGEAIYNDASGMVEGNNPFQVVWLPEDEREGWLQRIAALADERNLRPAEPQIVFEGNVPADITVNQPLKTALRKPAHVSPSAASAWLGDAIAIKDPTAAVFRRQSGANLIMVGQRDEAALAMMATSLISLAAQYPPTTHADETNGAASDRAAPVTHPRFYIFDASPADSPHVGYLASVSAFLPHDIRNVAWRDVAETINEIAMELQRRTESDQADAPAIYLLIHALQRYKMLRQEDEYSFSSDGDAAKPDKQFATILREGPSVGIHTLAWCDTAANLSRSLDRQGLREFELRVLFQMSANDSSNLIDSPAAGKLGMHRALFFSEEQGTIEKFRPYALPSEPWLASLSAKQQA